MWRIIFINSRSWKTLLIYIKNSIFDNNFKFENCIKNFNRSSVSVLCIQVKNNWYQTKIFCQVRIKNCEIQIFVILNCVWNAGK